MGVYIKGITIDWLNRATVKEIDKMLNNFNMMVEVKEPHGRLIDADELTDYVGDFDKIHEVSTVIEAQGE